MKAMRLVATVVAILLVASGIQAAAESQTAKAWTRLYLMQHAGQVLENWDVRGNSHAPQLAKLEAWAEMKGIMYGDGNMPRRKNLAGVATSTQVGWMILVDRRLEPNGRFVALLHELGHVLTPHRLYADGTVAEREIFAELVAVQVADGAGLDVWAQTATYISTKASTDEQAHLVQAWGGDVDRVVVTLAGAIR